MRYIRFKKLEQFCLHVIVENLEKFIYSKNIPQKHIDFLLRVYSEEVFKKFSLREQVSEDCMLWFLNPHSKKVQLTTVSEKIASQLQIVGSTITSLSLKENLHVSENMIDAIIGSVPNAVHLDLSNSRFTGNNMMCIHRMCPVLVSLDLSNCWITLKGMENPSGTHQSLRKLDISGKYIKHHDVCVILKMFPMLEQLKARGMASMLYENHKRTYASDNVRYNLTEFIFNDDCGMRLNILNFFHAWTILCPYVTRVCIHSFVTQKEIEICSRFEFLEVLEIRNSFPESNNMFMDADEWRKYRNSGTINVLAPFIPKGSRLTKLVLTNFGISIKILIECFENLKTLCLTDVHFTDFLEEGLTLKENKLEVLVLKQIHFDVPTTCRAILSLVSVSTNVVTLHLLGYMPPQNVCDAILNSMKNLTYVRTFASFFPDSIHRFFEIPSLEIYVDDDCWNTTSWGTAFDCAFPFPSTPISSTLSWCQYDYEDSENSDIEYYESSDDFEIVFQIPQLPEIDYVTRFK